MKQTVKVKPFEIFVPFLQRSETDEAERIVEGYAFVNEVVPGEGGIRIKRSAMEAATEDYMKWGAIREMHQPKAAGTAIEAKWDATGLKIRAKIVDDQAWEKVLERVYKGFSIGVAPTVIRGKDVEQLTHFENSLVDRPKDVDALITAYRSVTPETEFECEMEEEPPLTRAFADMIADLKADDLRSDMSAAWWAFIDYCVGYRESVTPETLHADIDQFCAYLHSIVDEPEHGLEKRFVATLKHRPDPVSLARLEGLQAEHTQTLARVQEQETELVTVRGELAAAIERAEKLAKQPVPVNAPIRYPQLAVDRNFAGDGDNVQRVAALQNELRDLTHTPRTNHGEQQAAVVRVQQIKRELAALGQ